MIGHSPRVTPGLRSSESITNPLLDRIPAASKHPFPVLPCQWVFRVTNISGSAQLTTGGRVVYRSRMSMGMKVGPGGTSPAAALIGAALLPLAVLLGRKLAASSALDADRRRLAQDFSAAGRRITTFHPPFERAGHP